jgi:signal transduction histidine kinase
MRIKNIKEDRGKINKSVRPFLGRLKLQGQFFFYFTGLIVLVVFFVSVAIFYFQRRMILHQAQEKAFSLTRSLAYTSLNAILLDDYVILQSLISSMMDGPDIISITILDTTGRIIASSTAEKRGEIMDDPATKKALATDRLLIQKSSNGSNHQVWDTVVPIFELNQRRGIALLKYSLEDPFKGLIWTIMIIGLIAITLSMGLAYRFSRSISKPIRQAVNLATEYGKGNLDAAIQMEREDEIGELVQSLNKLSNELKTLIDEKIANENLVMMGEFAGYIIHDLKNPLSGIHLLAEGLNRKIEEGSPIQKYSNEILLATQKLHDFVARTLDVARWSKLNLRPVNLPELIDSVVKDVKFSSIEISTINDPGMPEFQGDYQLLEMALKNLVTNAAEAIIERGKIKIETEWNGEVVIKISDTGTGIPEDRIKSIFRPFFSMKKQGHGLGLAMVRKAVVLHHGRIEVESKVGTGSTFIVTLPGNL